MKIGELLRYLPESIFDYDNQKKIYQNWSLLDKEEKIIPKLDFQIPYDDDEQNTHENDEW